MVKRKKIVFYLCLILLLLHGRFATAVVYGEETAASNVMEFDGVKGGIEIEDKDYKKDDSINVKVSLENNSDQDIFNVTIKSIAVDGYQWEIDESLESIASGDLESISTKAMPDVKEDKEDVQESDGEDNESDEESNAVLFIVIGVGVCVLVLGIFLLRKKKGKNIVSMILVFCMGTSLFQPGVAKADEEADVWEFKVSQVVQVEGQDVSFGVTIRYEKLSQVASLEEMTKEDIKITYMTWQNYYDVLKEEWNYRYPNIEIDMKQVSALDYSDTLMSLIGTSKMPDVFDVMGNVDVMMENWSFANLEGMWQLDEDTTNLIHGINEFGLGKYQMEDRWMVPIRFYPTVAWLNMGYFERAGVSMPDTDWTFEEMNRLIEQLSDNPNGWGISDSGYNVITWYPIVADADCIGEFGWDGQQFDLTHWEEGYNYIEEWRQKGFIAPNWLHDSSAHPIEEGKTAIDISPWFNWNGYDDATYYENKNYMVPYMLPNTESNSAGNVGFATMDFGAVSSDTEYVREAYEVLKFFGWGNDGWDVKLSNIDLIESSLDEYQATPLDECPITNDNNVWELYMNYYPTEQSGDWVEVDRTIYFDTFFDGVRTNKWTIYGSYMIPGFLKWYTDQYGYMKEIDADKEDMENSLNDAYRSEKDRILNILY